MQICIIDNDPIFVFGTKKLMQLHGLSDDFLVFDNGKQAIEGFRNRIADNIPLPDVVLLDLNMPIMDGWAFLDEFQNLPQCEQIVVHIITSSINPNDVERVKNYRLISKFLTKPLKKEVMQEIIQHAQAK